MDIIVQRVREQRMKLGLTQQQLAFDTGLSIGGIQSIEIGRAKPNIDTLVKLADRFGCTADYLLGRTDDPKGTTRVRWSDIHNLHLEPIAQFFDKIGDDEGQWFRNWTEKFPNNDNELTDEEDKTMEKALDEIVELFERAEKRIREIQDKKEDS